MVKGGTGVIQLLWTTLNYDEHNECLAFIAVPLNANVSHPSRQCIRRYDISPQLFVPHPFRRY
jgi:hypothetical protein